MVRRSKATAEDLLAIVRRPMSAHEGKTLVRQRQLLEWLKSQRTDYRLVLYGSAYDGSSLFIHSVLVPSSSLANGWDDLRNWEGNPYDAPSCGLVHGGGQPPRIEYSDSFADQLSKSLTGAQRLIFGRSFEGRIGQKGYFELAQHIALAHNLHWLEHRQAWCRLDDEGDVVDLAGVDVAERGPAGRSATVVWIDRDLLEMHMAATDTCFVQMFDCTRIPERFAGYRGGQEKVRTDLRVGLTYKFRIARDASYFRGAQVIRPAKTASQLGGLAYARANQPRKYESFIIQDIKNDRIVKCSCAPSATASYFDRDSRLPFQTSPVFFNAAVLDKYKADPDKYRLEDRSIGCRNSWHLQTYDVNEAGQVHTMIRYLGYLPLSEQRYWKAFNEAPKGPISRRSFQTDFEGTFDTEPDGLRDLKGLLSRLGEGEQRWFTLREPDLVGQLHYPHTNATKAWDDTIIGMAKSAVEGLEKRHLITVAREGGRSGDPSWGSIKWLREALLAKGADEDRAAEIVAPFEEIQHLRTKLAAHSRGAEATKIRQNLLQEHRTPRRHIESLSSRVVEALQAVNDVLVERQGKS